MAGKSGHYGHLFARFSRSLRSLKPYQRRILRAMILDPVELACSRKSKSALGRRPAQVKRRKFHAASRLPRRQVHFGSRWLQAIEMKDQGLDNSIFTLRGQLLAVEEHVQRANVSCPHHNLAIALHHLLCGG